MIFLTGTYLYSKWSGIQKVLHCVYLLQSKIVLNTLILGNKLRDPFLITVVSTYASTCSIRSQTSKKKKKSPRYSNLMKLHRLECFVWFELWVQQEMVHMKFDQILQFE